MVRRNNHPLGERSESELEVICKEVDSKSRLISNQALLPSWIYTPNEACTEINNVLNLVEYAGNDEAILGILHMESLIRPVFKEKMDLSPIGKGKRIVPGASSGLCFTDPSKALAYLQRNSQLSEGIILATTELNWKDIEPSYNLRGIVTTSDILEGTHPKALLASSGIPTISKCKNLVIQKGGAHFGNVLIKNGDYLSMDGSRGEVYLGKHDVITSPIISDAERLSKGESVPLSRESQLYRRLLAQLQRITEDYNGMGVYAFVSSLEDMNLAKVLSMDGGKSAIKGIGMVKTENSFRSEEDKTDLIRLLLSKDDNTKNRSRERIFEKQKELFKKLLTNMNGMPVQIRLLDSLEDIFKNFYYESGDRINTGLSLHEFLYYLKELKSDNPFKLRGVGIAFRYPQVYNLQIEAILQAAYELKGDNAKPRVVVPFVRDEGEIEFIRNLIGNAYMRMSIDKNEVPVMLGSMVETVSSCEKIVELYRKGAKFFVFGTNDLTQSCLSLARGDAKEIMHRVESGILPKDPFTYLPNYVKHKIRVALGGIASLGKGTVIDYGVSGRHVCNPEDLRFFHNAGMKYVAVTPYELPQVLLDVTKSAILSERER